MKKRFLCHWIGQSLYTTSYPETESFDWSMYSQDVPFYPPPTKERFKKCAKAPQLSSYLLRLTKVEKCGYGEFLHILNSTNIIIKCLLLIVLLLISADLVAVVKYYHWQ